MTQLKRDIPESPELIKDGKLLKMHKKKLLEKIKFLQECDETKFYTWKKKTCGCSYSGSAQSEGFS